MIKEIYGLAGNNLLPLNSAKNIPQKGSFAQTLKSVIADVNDMQFESKNMKDAFIRGDIEDLHQVTLTASKARIGFELLMEIRNKLLESYKEIMRMPV